ncbi:DUF6578 domain-containing protein [Geodermatophilus sp. SYSU D00684]
MSEEPDVEVFLADREIECCRPPPGRGDRVSWPLQWVDDPAGPGARQVPWRARPLSGATDLGLLLRHERLTARWRAGGAEVPGRGALLADAHGQVPEQVPPVPGRVVRVHVVVRTWRLRPPRTYDPVDGEFELRPVDRGPRWFDPGPVSSRSRSRPAGRAACWWGSGWAEVSAGRRGRCAPGGCRRCSRRRGGSRPA